MREVVDLGEIVLVHDEDYARRPAVWLSPAGGVIPSQRLIDALANGETTWGGLAEAGWRFLGRLGESQ